MSIKGVEYTPLYRYWKPEGSDHFYTTNTNEIGTVVHGLTGRHSYVCEGTQGQVFTSRFPGTVPLYRYYRGQNQDHFYTTNSGEIGTTTAGQTGRHGYVSEGITGYCFPHSSYPGTIPLYRYWKGSVGDHFYTTNSNEIGTIQPGHTGHYGYVSEGVACYVLNR